MDAKQFTMTEASSAGSSRVATLAANLETSIGKSSLTESSIAKYKRLSKVGIESIFESPPKYEESLEGIKIIKLTSDHHPVRNNPVYKLIQPISGFDANKKSIGLTFLPDQSKILYKQRGTRFTLMVAGSAGTGKSSFINTLFNSNLIPFGQTERIRVNQYELIEDGFKLNLTAVDTPGFDGAINNEYAWAPITRYIDEQFRLYLYCSEQPNRSELIDSRVHCCLYFIQPTGSYLRPLDVKAMKALSTRVNVIPIIGKGDTLSHEDLLKFKAIVQKTLKLYDIQVCKFLDTEVYEKVHSMVPFVVIGSEFSNGENRGREYPWGTVEVENSLHNDFVKLRDVLMESNMLDLILLSENYYESYRSTCLELRAKQQEKDFTILDGIGQYMLYHECTLNQIEVLLPSCDPIHEAEVQRLKDTYDTQFTKQEKKFKQWKMALVEKQDYLNSKIGEQQAVMSRLQVETDTLKNGFDLDVDIFKL